MIETNTRSLHCIAHAVMRGLGRSFGNNNTKLSLKIRTWCIKAASLHKMKVHEKLPLWSLHCLQWFISSLWSWENKWTSREKMWLQQPVWHSAPTSLAMGRFVDYHHVLVMWLRLDDMDDRDNEAKVLSQTANFQQQMHLFPLKDCSIVIPWCRSHFERYLLN